MSSKEKKEFKAVIDIGYGLFVTIICLAAWGVLVAIFFDQLLGLSLIILMVISFSATYSYRLKKWKAEQEALQSA